MNIYAKLDNTTVSRISIEKEIFIEKDQTIEIEHPYNMTFIHNTKALELFGNMKLFEK